MEKDKDQNLQIENSEKDSPFEVPPMKLSIYEQAPNNFDDKKSEDN